MATSFVTLTNTARQPVSVQLKRPDGDFYLEERQVRIPKGKSVTLPRDHLMMAQIENLKVRQQLQTANA